MHTLIKTVLVLAAAAPLTAFATDIEVRAAVSTAGLDLSRPHDIAVLRHRAALAVEAVCGSYAGAGVDRADQITACRRQVFTTLAPKLDRAVAEAKINGRQAG